jgi:hypothetical protein
MDEVLFPPGDHGRMVAGTERIGKGDIVISSAAQGDLRVPEFEVKIVALFRVDIQFRHDSSVPDYSLFIENNSSMP